MKEFFENIKQTYIRFKKAIIVILICIIVEQIIMIAVPYLTGRIADVLMKSGDTAFKTAILIALLIFSLRMFSRLIFWVREKQEIKNMVFDIGRVNFLEGINHHTKLSGGQHISENSEKRRSTISRGTASATSLSMMFFYEIFPDIVKIMIVFTALVFFNSIVGLFVISIFAIGFVFQIFFTNKAMPGFDKWQEMIKTQDKVAGEHAKNIMLTKNFGKESDAKKEIKEIFKKTDSHIKKVWYSFMKKLLLINSLNPVTGVISMGILIYQVSYGFISLGEFIFVSMWVNMAMNQVARAQHYQRRIMRILPAYRDLQKEYKVKSNILVQDNPISGIVLEGKIEFKNVSFSYKNNNNALGLKDSSIVIFPGQKIGITGLSGAGKSTFVNLLLRHFDPESGQVLIDDNDLRLIDLEEYKSTSIGFVSQDNFLFDKSVRYNVAYSGTHIKDEQIIKALKIANLHHRIMSHEDGLDALIGEGGINLSGGEKQRLSIARAVVKNPKILIFDEATSSVDSTNEKLIQDSLDKASKGKTMIAIAHRLPTIQNADKILFFEDGQIKHSGTHRELLSISKGYASLCGEQSLRIA